jgi:8-oxo-dGTP diphosphatase
MKVTVDIIIEILNDGNTSSPGIVLIDRKYEPLGYALPGGHVDDGETTMEAAAREALEETSLKVTNLKQFHTYSHPKRDPRYQTVTVVYTGVASGMPEGRDDALSAWIANEEWIARHGNSLCCDHTQILTEYFNFKKTGERPNRE